MTSLFLTPKEQAAEKRFQVFHAANPEIYMEIVCRARALVANGYRHFGIRAIWEAMRFDAMVRVKHKPGTVKMNDHFTAPYSRLIMSREPDLKSIFETRGSHESGE